MPRPDLSPGIRNISPLFTVLLHEPEIPNNTGNIGRTCVALSCALHLVRPLGFDTSVHALRRAGLDYWPRLGVVEHDDWPAAVRSLRLPPTGDARVWTYTTRASRPHWDADIRRGDILLFGKETRGLPDDVLQQFPDRLLTLPMAPGERSLNLATAVCAALYEGLRQCVSRGEVGLDAEGRLKFSP